MVILTEKEKTVSRMFALEGLSVRRIAALRGVSEYTIRGYVKNIYRKLEISGHGHGAKKYALKKYIQSNADQFVSEYKKGMINLETNLAGFWLSRFEYVYVRNGESKMGIQYGIENLESTDSYQTYSGRNICPINDLNQEGFLYMVNAELDNDSVCGTWKNRTTRHAGVFMLHAYQTFSYLSGMHLGKSSNNDIQHGRWDWIRLDIKECSLGSIHGMHLDFNKLELEFSKFTMTHATISLDYLLQTMVAE